MNFHITFVQQSHFIKRFFMSKVLVIRKPDGTIQRTQLRNKATLMALSNRLPVGKQWQFEEMSEDKANALPFIDPDFIPAGEAVNKLKVVTGQLEEKDAEIERLKQQLAGLQSAGAGGGGNVAALKKVYALNVKDTVALINKSKDAAAVNELIKDEDRKGVLDAATKKIASFA